METEEKFINLLFLLAIDFFSEMCKMVWGKYSPLIKGKHASLVTD